VPLVRSGTGGPHIDMRHRAPGIFSQSNRRQPLGVIAPGEHGTSSRRLALWPNETFKGDAPPDLHAARAVVPKHP